jgi:hypothetical protein
MPIVREKEKIRVQSFNGGENSTGEEGIVKTPYATLARNCYIDEPGKVIQREGLSPQGDNPDSLISKWTFSNSDATDGKSSNDGTETSISYAAGKHGIAAWFNGTSSNINIPGATEIDITSMGTFTNVVWVYPESDGENDEGHIWTKGEHYAYVWGESGGTVKLGFKLDYDVGTDALVTTTTTINTGEWSRIEFINQSDNSLDIVINGVLATYDTDTTGVGTLYDDGSDALVIGSNAAQSRTFDGGIDEFRWYNAARTAAEYELDKIYGITRYKVGETVDRVYRVRDTKIEKLDSDFKGWTSVYSSLTADKDTQFIQANDRLFILNGTDTVRSMDSSEAFTDEGQGAEEGGGTSTNPPKGTFGCWAQNNRMFISGHLTESLRDYIWFSDALDPQTWNTTLGTGNFFRVMSGSGGKVTWIQPFKLNELIIYKEDSIHVLDMTGTTPLTNWTLQPLNQKVGCKAGRTVKDVGNDQIFLDNEGFVRLLSRTSFDKLLTSVISGPVQDILDTINIDAIHKACSEVVDGKYFLSFPTGSSLENDTTLMWDTAVSTAIGEPEAGWTVIPQNDWNIGYMTTFEFGDNRLSLVLADNRNLSLVYKLSGNNDNGDSIIMQVAGPQHDGGNRGTDKIWGPLYVVCDAGVATSVTIYADIDSSGFLSVGTLSLTGGALTLPFDLPASLGGSDKAEQLFHVKHLGRGRTCRIMIEHSGYNSNVTVNEYELHWEQRIPRA